MILDYTNNDTLSGNVMTHNGIEIYENYLSTGNTHNIDTSNTVNGRPVCYYSNESGTTVPGGAGQVILAGCTDFIIEGQNLSNASLGIEVLYSSEIMINNNECSNDFYGILLLSSNSCVVSNTTCSNNTEGIVLSSSNNNTLRNNDCSYNFDGIQLVFSSNNIISDNNCSSNDEYGIALSFWNSANTISRNQVCSNTGYGVYIDSGLNNRIWNNTFVGNNGATGAYSSMHIQCLDYGTNNWWNSTAGYGNYWNDWITPDANHDGIVDLPYDIAGSAGAKDYYPQTTTQTQIPEFGMMSLVVIGLMSVIVVAGEAKRKKKSCS
jgi:parallel beta-helix repeat protein